MSHIAATSMFERIIEGTPTGVWALDADSITSYVNPAMAEMLGYGRDELVGRSLFEMMDEEGRRIAAANVERRKQGIAEAHEFVFRRKDGTTLWARLITHALAGPATEYSGAVALVTDITGEREKDAERQRLWRIFDESLNEIYLFRASELRFVYINRGALRNLGFTLDEMRVMTPLDIKPLHTEESFRALTAPLVEGRAQKTVFRTVHRRKDGSTYPVEVHLQLVPGAAGDEFLAIIDDISSREDAERALRENEARHRALIASSLDMILLTDASGRVTYASPSVTSVMGFPPAEVIGLAVLDLVHPDDRSSAQRFLGRAIAGEANAPLEFRARHRDGSWRHLASHGRNMLDDPAVGALVLNARDVTNERKLEEHLHQSQRLESIGRLAGGIAHDFNNILTTILSSASFLEENSSLSDADRADVREIRLASERASELTSQLLAFARRRIIRLESVELGQMIVRQQRFLTRVIGEQIELTTRIAEDVWPVLADPSQVEQVIINLAVNARDAMRRTGKLTLEVENVTIDASVAESHGNVRPGPYVLLAVSDTGEGIPSDVLPHIFEPFFTTKPVGVGTGLGLASVYGIMRQIDGHIWVDSEPGVGTTFKLYFPRSLQEAVPAAEHHAPASSGGAERILVVEDDEMVRGMLVRTLREAGYDVNAAGTPDDALGWVRAGHPFDLLLTDVVMPGMSGKELAEQVRAARPDARILFVSGYTENTIVHRGVLDEGVELLPKPFSPEVLRGRVRELLDRS